MVYTKQTQRHLHGHPVFLLLHVNRHWQVADLSGPHKPVTLKTPVENRKLSRRENCQEIIVEKQHPQLVFHWSAWCLYFIGQSGACISLVSLVLVFHWSAWCLYFIGQPGTCISLVSLVLVFHWSAWYLYFIGQPGTCISLVSLVLGIVQRACRVQSYC